MADLRGQRSVVWAVPVLLVAAVVAAAFLLGNGDDAPRRDGAGDRSTSAAPSPAAPTTKVDPDTWCTAFREFAEAQSQYVGAPDDPGTQAALQDTADALLGLGQPLGLSAGGATSLQLLVDGALSQAGEPTVSPGAAPADDQAFADFLSASCPA